MVPPHAPPPTPFPFYVVLDVSASMRRLDILPEGASQTPFDTVERYLPELVAVLQNRGSLPEAFRDIDILDIFAAQEVAHIGFITFADDARVLVPLTSVKDTRLRVPPLPRDGTSTNYAAVFYLLAQTVKADLDAFDKAFLPGWHYHPVVFFITDGNAEVNGDQQRREGSAGWGVYYDWFLKNVGDGSREPVLLPLGLGQVERSTIAALAHLTDGFIAGPGANAAYLLEAIIPSICRSISLSSGNGKFQFELPGGLGMERVASQR